MNGIKALFSSEKAIAAGVLVIISTLFVVLGKMTVAQWNEYTLWALGIYTGGKTVQGVSQAVVNADSQSVTESSGTTNIVVGSLGGGKGGGDIAGPVGGIGTSPKERT
jgi:hypothetical protein